MGVAALKPHPIDDVAQRAPLLKSLEITRASIIIIIIITNLYTGCTFQHKNAVINMCPVKE